MATPSLSCRRRIQPLLSSALILTVLCCCIWSGVRPLEAWQPQTSRPDRSLIDRSVNLDSPKSASSSLDQPTTRRQILSQSLLTSITTTSWMMLWTTTPPSSWSATAPSVTKDTTLQKDSRATITVRLETAGDTLGVEVADTQLRGRSIVIIRRITKVNKWNRKLQEGLVLEGYTSAKELVDRIRSGPYPLELTFRNLAAGGDAFDDLGTTIVAPKDALVLAQRTEDSPDTTIGGPSTSTPFETSPRKGLSITTLRRPDGSPSQPCAMKSRRGDLVELNYEASYLVRRKNDNTNDDDGDKTTIKKVVYDASAFRGTGRPFQLVLGTGDVIPGVDQGLYDMCPGESRRLEIPAVLGYGSQGARVFRIPPDYIGLEWTVELVSIEGMVREDNNNLSRQERENRALY